MRLTYNPKTDVLQVRLRANRIHDSEEVEPGVKVQYDDEGHVVGLELSAARKRLTLEELTSVTYENLAIHQRSSLNLP